jgi:hypothetical protein
MLTAPAKDFRETNFTVLPASYGERQLGSEEHCGRARAFSRPTNSIISGHEPEDRWSKVETQLMMAQNLTYFPPEHGKDRMDRAAELGKILNGLIGDMRPAA